MILVFALYITTVQAVAYRGSENKKVEDPCIGSCGHV